MRAVLILLLAVCVAPAGEKPVDGLGLALEKMGIEAKDLGYRPKAHWARYPHPKTTPYVLPFFEDLLANPLDTYVFTRTMGNAVEEHLSAELLTVAPTASRRKETLFRLAVMLGTDRCVGGFRGYSANLDPRPTKTEPLLHAFITLLERSGKPLRRPMSFGAKYDKGEPSPREKLREEVATLPEAMRLPLARFVLNLVQAREWIDLGLRDVPQEMRDRVFEILPTLVEDTPDGTGYYPVIDDVAKRIDWHSLYYGCLKALQATQDARRELEGIGFPPELDFRLPTPWGAVRIGVGAVEESDPLLVVTCGATDEVRGPIGATGPKRPLSVALCLGSGGTLGDAESRVASGILGCGVVYSSGSHSTTYRSADFGQGCGVFGLGALVEEGGDDAYKLAAAGQGAGMFGIGLLLDAGGKDAYELTEGDGQGFGGPAGVGVLADRFGDDRYYVERDPKIAGRADYHSKDAIAANNAQGAGFGRRGDGADGHNWAGGLGALIDVDGNDKYIAGNFTQGIGYWYGTGLLWDGGGDDEYRSVYFTQGSGAHFAVGALIDEGGNDKHILEHNAGAGLGFGWDVVNAFLIDRGSGNDLYDARIISTGLAEVRSNAFLIDEGGDDTYILDAKQRGFGDVDERPEYKEPRKTAPFQFRLDQMGLLLDLSGKDRYLRRDKEGELSPDETAGDGRSWNLRTRAVAGRGGFNVSCGLDLECGVLGFLEPWPARETTK